MPQVSREAPRPLELPAVFAGTVNKHRQMGPVVGASKGEIIVNVAASIQKYNFLLPTFLLQWRANPRYVLDAKGVRLLDAICLDVLTYLAAKPPGARKASGQDKWNAALAMTRQAGGTRARLQYQAARRAVRPGQGRWPQLLARATQPASKRIWRVG